MSWWVFALAVFGSAVGVLVLGALIGAVFATLMDSSW